MEKLLKPFFKIRSASNKLTCFTFVEKSFLLSSLLKDIFTQHRFKVEVLFFQNLQHVLFISVFHGYILSLKLVSHARFFILCSMVFCQHFLLVFRFQKFNYDVTWQSFCLFLFCFLVYPVCGSLGFSKL
jgi:hypothetical protein